MQNGKTSYIHSYSAAVAMLLWSHDSTSQAPAWCALWGRWSAVYLGYGADEPPTPSQQTGEKLVSNTGKAFSLTIFIYFSLLGAHVCVFLKFYVVNKTFITARVSSVPSQWVRTRRRKGLCVEKSGSDRHTRLGNIASTVTFG